jgi:hypothetical protein
MGCKGSKNNKAEEPKEPSPPPLTPGEHAAARSLYVALCRKYVPHEEVRVHMVDSYPHFYVKRNQQLMEQFKLEAEPSDEERTLLYWRTVGLVILYRESKRTHFGDRQVAAMGDLVDAHDDDIEAFAKSLILEFCEGAGKTPLPAEGGEMWCHYIHYHRIRTQADKARDEELAKRQTRRGNQGSLDIRDVIAGIARLV